MTDLDPIKVERLWRDANDAEIVQALDALDDYERGVPEIIQREAACRGLARTDCDLSPPPESDDGTGALYGCHSFLAAHRCIMASLWGESPLFAR